MIPPYDPRKHRVLDPADPPLWKRVLLVFALFVAAPLAAAGLVELAMKVNFIFLVIGIALAGGGLAYGIYNMEAIEDDEET